MRHVLWECPAPAEPLERCTLADPAIPAHEEGGDQVVRRPKDGDDEGAPEGGTIEEVGQAVDDGDRQQCQAGRWHPEVLDVAPGHEASTL